jgi:hypothetical protein
LRKATSLFEPAEFHKESVGLSQSLGVILAAIEEAVAGVFQVAKHEVTHEQYVETLSLLDNLVFFIFFTYS